MSSKLPNPRTRPPDFRPKVSAPKRTSRATPVVNAPTPVSQERVQGRAHERAAVSQNSEAPSSQNVLGWFSICSGPVVVSFISPTQEDGSMLLHRLFESQGWANPTSHPPTMPLVQGQQGSGEDMHTAVSRSVIESCPPGLLHHHHDAEKRILSFLLVTGEPRDEVAVHKAKLLLFMTSHVVVWVGSAQNVDSAVFTTLRRLQEAKISLLTILPSACLPPISPQPSPGMGMKGSVYAAGRGVAKQAQDAQSSPKPPPHAGQTSPILLFLLPEVEAVGSQVHRAEEAQLRSLLRKSRGASGLFSLDPSCCLLFFNKDRNRAGAALDLVTSSLDAILESAVLWGGGAETVGLGVVRDPDVETIRSFVTRHVGSGPDLWVSVFGRLCSLLWPPQQGGQKKATPDFSSVWCSKLYPAARDVYLETLPPLYSTREHLARRERALAFFEARVRGPAVGLWRGRLAEECERVWQGGRQGCDAVSLTGRPCVNPRHSPPDPPQLHSSGVRFLQACGCGRTRRVVEDPFALESAEVKVVQLTACAPSLGESCGPLDLACWGVAVLGSTAEGLVREEFVEGFSSLSTLQLLASDLRATPAPSLPQALQNAAAWKQRRESSSRARGSKGEGGGRGKGVRRTADAFPPLLQKEAFPPLGTSAGGKKRGEGGTGEEGKEVAELSVGLEFECPAGHRFLLPLDAPQLAQPLPLFRPCPAPQCTPVEVAQLMRMFVVSLEGGEDDAGTDSVQCLGSLPDHTGVTCHLLQLSRGGCGGKGSLLSPSCHPPPKRQTVLHQIPLPLSPGCSPSHSSAGAARVPSEDCSSNEGWNSGQSDHQSHLSLQEVAERVETCRSRHSHVQP